LQLTHPPILYVEIVSLAITRHVKPLVLLGLRLLKERPHVPEANRCHQYKLVCFIVWELFVLSGPLLSELFWQLLITTAATRKAIQSWQMPSEI